jgi:hypothetical protein
MIAGKHRPPRQLDPKYSLYVWINHELQNFVTELRILKDLVDIVIDTFPVRFQYT